MMVKSWTVADVLAESPCLSPDAIRGYFGGHESLTLQQILALPTLRDEHKVWIACRREAVPVKVYAAWQQMVLTRIITMYALPEPSTHEWAVRWLNGTNKTEDIAARAAEAAWAAEAARAEEYHTQVLELQQLLNAEDTPHV